MHGLSRLLAMLALAVASQASQAWNKDYQTRYVLGDSDSRLTARQNALSQLQLQAAKEAGTYVRGDTRLVNDQLDEQIQQVSAAVVRLEVLSERFEISSTGQQLLFLSARASVDESVLQERVQDLRQAEQQRAQVQDLQQVSQELRRQLAAINEQRQLQQQQLASENQQLRQQLQQQVIRQPTLVPTPPVADPVSTLTPSASAPLSTEDTQAWFERIWLNWRQLPVTARIAARKPVTEGTATALLLDVDWQMSLAMNAPLAELCQRWTCQLGLAYRMPFEDVSLTPLHQQLFRPVSRLAHMEDKYLDRWQLLTVQIQTPRPTTASERQRWDAWLASRQLQVQAGLAGEQYHWPLLRYDRKSGVLVLWLQGTLNSRDATRYDSSTHTGAVLCAQDWYQKPCLYGDASVSLLRLVQVAGSLSDSALQAMVTAAPDEPVQMAGSGAP